MAVLCLDAVICLDPTVFTVVLLTLLLVIMIRFARIFWT